MCSGCSCYLLHWLCAHVSLITPHYTALQLGQVYNREVKYIQVQCNAVQCSAVQCSAVQCSAMQCSAVQCSAVQCSARQAVWGRPNHIPSSDRHLAGPGLWLPFVDATVFTDTVGGHSPTNQCYFIQASNEVGEMFSKHT